ncbi:guanine deaminase [Thalassomonas haliotis]|uniref:Guanine deaminase n=1 Tax=Thalassomonas haliotis TaxID=485448 RepID=A0ABY7VNI6_9GAMM|nr:guanine deaminase [Thalassomonas haliotis]WDE14052.1 guanine deaminase [Thalassomonas haliotis]
MLKVYRGEILHFLADPAKVALEQSYQHFADGLLVIEDGKVKQLGEASSLLASLAADVEVTHYQNGLIMPGFIDTHIHYPQTEMIASYGEQLLEWLENYTFPAERRFEDEAYAKDVAEFFLDQLLDAGTTTALVFGTVHKASVDAFFTVAQQKKLRMICGKVLMDRNCPDFLTDTAETGFTDSKALIEKWHNTDRLQYAVTPRFAPTSTREQLDKAGELLSLYPDVYMHTHLCENKKEIEWVQALFPENNGYLDVYDQSNLLGRRSVFAHGVHLHDEECQRLSDTGSAIAFCPTSNLFLGSGLFNLKQAEEYDVNVGMGTDVGAGTSFSILRSLNEAYKIQQLRGEKLTPFKSFYLSTLGGAVALDLEDQIGNLAPGKEADFIVLDYNATPLMERRIKQCKTLHEKLFVLSMLGDERNVCATHILGEKVGERVTGKA